MLPEAVGDDDVEALEIGKQPGFECSSVGVGAFGRADGVDGERVTSEESGAWCIEAEDFAVGTLRCQGGDHVADGLAETALGGVHAGDDVEDFHAGGADYSTNEV